MQFTDFQASSIQPSSATTIEEWLHEVWPEVKLNPLRLLVCNQSEGAAEAMRGYAEYLAGLVAAHLTYFPGKIQTGNSLDDLAETAREGYDLVIFGEIKPSLLKRLFKPATGRQAIKLMPTSVLLARPPLRPLRRILFVTRGQPQEAVALDWLVELAQPSGAVVTILAVLPSSPVYFSEALERYGLSNWLTSNTPLGAQLQQIDQRLEGWAVEGKLRFRPGRPETQIKQEIHESDPDLVIIAADPERWWQKCVPGQLVDPLLSWIDRPVLIAK